MPPPQYLRHNPRRGRVAQNRVHLPDFEVSRTHQLRVGAPRTAHIVRFRFFAAVDRPGDELLERHHRAATDAAGATRQTGVG